MSFVGTFGSFTVARLGIYSAQKGLSVAGNNIANINTQGYTRQALDQVSLRTGGADRYQSQFDARVGTGVLCTGVSQLRDPYLDIRYRNEMSSVGAADGKLAGLENLAAILDEVAKGGDENGVIEAELSELYKALQNLSDPTGQSGYDTQVRSSASALVTLFNSYAKRLEDVEKNAIKGLKQDIESVNKILGNIRDLNSSIRKSEIHGDSALELRDERNRLIDELSQYMKVDVVYTMEDIGGGQMVEKLTIKLGNANPDPNVNTDQAVLVDGVYATQLGIVKSPEPNPDYDPNDPNSLPYLDANGTPTADAAQANMIDNYDIQLAELRDTKNRPLDGSVAVRLDDNDLYGSLQAAREMLTEAGEFASKGYVNGVDEKAATKRGIPYYRHTLDLLANKIANEFNKANNGYQVDQDGNYLDANGDILLDPADNTTPLNKKTPLNDAQRAFLEANGKPLGGNLFSNHGDSDEGTGITAANISISKSWANGDVHIVNSFVKPTGLDTGSTDTSNILHMISLMTDKNMEYLPSDVVDTAGSAPLFKGTFQEMLGNIGFVLGNDQRSTQILLNTYYAASVDLDTSRDAVSGVDLNDEAASLMQYQKSYAAACRLMTTLDETLDKLINGTGVVGR